MPSLSKKDKLRIKKSASKEGYSSLLSKNVKGVAAIAAGGPADVADTALSFVKDKFNQKYINKAQSAIKPFTSTSLKKSWGVTGDADLTSEVISMALPAGALVKGVKAVKQAGKAAKKMLVKDIHGKTHKVNKPLPFKAVEDAKNKTNLKIKTKASEERAPLIAESKKYRESFGSHRVVEPTLRDKLFPAKTYEDYKYAKKPSHERADNEMEIIHGTDKKKIDRIKKAKENRSFLNKEYKIEDVGPKQRDMGEGESKQKWVTDTDLDVAMNKTFFESTSPQDFDKNLKSMNKLGDKYEDQTHDKFKDFNSRLVDHHIQAVDQTRTAAQGRGKTLSRVYLKKEPPELQKFGEGKEEDIAGLHKDLSKTGATTHGNTGYFTEEELDHETTQRFLAKTRKFGKQQAENKKISTGDLGDGTRAWPKGAKVSDILHGKGQKFRESEKLKIEKKEATKQKRAETLREKKEGTKVSRQEGWDVEEKAIIGGMETTTTFRKYRQERAKEIKSVPQGKKRREYYKENIGPHKTTKYIKSKKDDNWYPF